MIGVTPGRPRSSIVCTASTRFRRRQSRKRGVRRLLKRFTDEAGIEPDGEYDYLTLHGARRALGRDLYTGGMSEKAQEALRHNSIETTHEAYADVKMKDVSDSIDDVRG